MVAMMRFLLACTLAATTLGAADLSGVRSVYLLPMARGLDQYLANRLTNEGVFQVVTDPAKADAFFTDRVGEGFEQKLADLLPEPEKPAEAKAEEDKAGEDKDKKDNDKKEAKKESAKKDAKQATDARGDISPGSAPANKLAKVGSMSSFSRAQGTVFLVDAKTRLVLWSAYDPPRDGTSRQLDRTATSLVAQIKKQKQ